VRHACRSCAACAKIIPLGSRVAAVRPWAYSSLRRPRLDQRAITVKCSDDNRSFPRHFDDRIGRSRCRQVLLHQPLPQAREVRLLEPASSRLMSRNPTGTGCCSRASGRTAGPSGTDTAHQQLAFKSCSGGIDGDRPRHTRLQLARQLLQHRSVCALDAAQADDPPALATPAKVTEHVP